MRHALVVTATRANADWEAAVSIKTILVPTEQHDLMTSTLETAALLARKFESYI